MGIRPKNYSTRLVLSLSKYPLLLRRFLAGYAFLRCAR